MPALNQNPEQEARDNIDQQLTQAGWLVQNPKQINLNAGLGIAVREYQTDVGPADYVLFVDRKAVGVIEAKKETEGYHLSIHEPQSQGYAVAKLKWVKNKEPLPFVYESTGIITYFTDGRDPKPRSHEIFNFHRPEELAKRLTEPSLRTRLLDTPLLNPDNKTANELGLRDCQERAITNLEKSFKLNKPRALVQMATGAGKTYTAITSIYRLLKHAKVKRILFVVDTRNLGKQAEQEMMAFTPSDDNRKFTELYSTQRPNSPHIADSSQVIICTIQRLYAILKGEDLDSLLEETNPAEFKMKRKESLPVVYNEKITPDFFDFIYIDECHRSIYNTWRQVLDYFDASLIGLTATPDNRTYGFFNKNIVSEYTHENAVADGVNVGNEIYLIKTAISQQGAKLEKGQKIERREKLTRKKRWEQNDEDTEYSAKQLDRDIVNPSQIRTIISEFNKQLPVIFPGRKEVPKTLIFAKTDSHADDIIRIVREEFGEGNDFCRKVTYNAGKDIKDKEGNLVQKGEDPDAALANFRNDFYPRITVTVDMIATGTDVRPLECLLFMRDVKSRNYFEQMKGRGTRVMGKDDLQKVSPSAITAKTHYVIVDAIGVTQSLKTASSPLIIKPSIPLKDLAMGIMMGAGDEDDISSLAGRLARLNNQLSPAEKNQIQQHAGMPITHIVKHLLDAIDADLVEAKALEIAKLPVGSDPGDQTREQAQQQLCQETGKLFTGDLIKLIDDIRRDKEQIIDHINIDEVEASEWAGDAQANAEALAQEFSDYLEQHQDEIAALTIYYQQPHRRREVTFQMIKELMEKLKSDQPKLAPIRVWNAFKALEGEAGSSIKQPLNELTALVALIRKVTDIDQVLSPYNDTVRKNFQNWIMKTHAGGDTKYTEAQMHWLHMMRDHVINSFHIERDDLDYAPFDAQGGMGKMYQLFGDQMDPLIEELNEALAA